VRVLVVEDDRDFRELLVEHLRTFGYEVEGAAGKEESLRALEKKDYAVVLLDLFLPDGNGMDVLKRVKESTPLTEVIVITGHGTIKTAVDAMKLGAYDFLTKPCSLKEVEVILRKAIESRDVKKENLLYKREKSFSMNCGELVFSSDAMKEVLNKVSKIARSDCPVLITGESGVGKEVVANLIHGRSERSSKPMVALNVASLPKDLLEAELFGYEKGAFTGADRGKEGFFELADGGTLFLDEIGEMDLSLQAKLLRAIETKRFYRVGGRREIHSDVRVMAATNRDLKKLVKEGRFREDLYYRLNVVEIHVPPLRERKEDILPLAYHFLSLFRRKYSKNVRGFSESAKRTLLEYHWPGNVRELRNTIERAVLFAEGDTVKTKDLSCILSGSPSEEGLKTIKELEKEYIERVLRMVNYNKRRASQILGIPLRTFYRKLEAYGIG